MAGLQNRIKISGAYLLVPVLSVIIFLLCTSYSFPDNAGPSLRVLCYHSFVGSSNRYSFSLQEFEDQIQLLLKKGYTFISPRDFLHRTYSGHGNILLTIDDGHRSAYDAYFKVLRKYSIKPVLAIYPAVIGCTGYGLTWEQLKELVDDGCCVASHGYSHYQLNDELYKKNKKLFNREVITSKRILEDKLKKEVTVFIYPYGVYSDSVFQALSDAGYQYAFTVKDAPVTQLAMASNALSLPRYMFTRHNSLALLGNIPSYTAASESSVEKNNEWIPYYKKIAISINKTALNKEKPFGLDRIKYEIVQPGIDYMKKKISLLKSDDILAFPLDGEASKDIVSAKPGLDITVMLSNNASQLKVDNPHLLIKKTAKELFYGSSKAYNQVLGYCNNKVHKLNNSMSLIINRDLIKRLINKSIPEQFKDKYLNNK